MTIYHLALLVVLSVSLTVLLKNKSKKVNARFQKYNDVFQLYELTHKEIIFETEYKKHIPKMIAINKQGTSVGISYLKHSKLRVFD